MKGMMQMMELGGGLTEAWRESGVYKCVTLVFKFLYIQFNQSDCAPFETFCFCL